MESRKANLKAPSHELLTQPPAGHQSKVVTPPKYNYYYGQAPWLRKVPLQNYCQAPWLRKMPLQVVL